jgi:hypothetical protein
MSLKNRFDSYVEKIPVTGCWLWTGGLNSRGYGAFFNDDGKTVGAHRVSWVIKNGEIPKGLFVLHRCDVPSCVNPSHLFLGTAKENTQDMIKKGRAPTREQYAHKNRRRGSNHPSVYLNERLPKGVLHHNAKLSESDVIAIRKSDASGVSLSKLYSVSTNTICRIRKNLIWRHI